MVTDVPKTDTMEPSISYLATSAALSSHLLLTLSLISWLDGAKIRGSESDVSQRNEKSTLRLHPNVQPLDLQTETSLTSVVCIMTCSLSSRSVI